MNTLQRAFESVLNDNSAQDGNVLRAIHNLNWEQLSAAAQQTNHPWRTMALSTTTDRRPHVRTVILRSAAPTSRVITVHTDRRSPKVTQLESHPAVSCLTYDAESRIQLRLDGDATLHTIGPIADSAWDQLPESSRRNYLTTNAPGDSISSPPADRIAVENSSMPPEAEAFARANFAVIECHIRSIDWLYLREGGHLRAFFRWNDDTASEEWLVP